MISKQTAYDLWICHDEIQKGEALLIELQEQLSRHETISLRDCFGRNRGLQLGVPTGENSHRLYDVAPAIAIEVIKSHIANKRIELSLINSRILDEAK